MISDEYVAGLIDGEGHISICDHKNGSKPRVIVAVGMTCEETVRALHDRFGGYFSVVERPYPRKTLYNWRAYNSRARVVINAIRDHVITKREAIDEVHRYLRETNQM